MTLVFWMQKLEMEPESSLKDNREEHVAIASNMNQFFSFNQESNNKGHMT